MTSKFVKMGYFTPLQPPRSILSPLSILKLRQEGHSGHFPNRYRYRSPSGPLDAPGCQGKEPLRLLRRLPTVTRVREVRDQPTNIWRPGVRRVGDQPTNPGPGVQIFGWQLGKTPGCREGVGNGCEGRRRQGGRRRRLWTQTASGRTVFRSTRVVYRTG